MALFSYNRLAGIGLLSLATGIALYEYHAKPSKPAGCPPQIITAQAGLEAVPCDLKELACQLAPEKSVSSHIKEQENIVQVAQGDTFLSILTKAGISREESSQAIKALGQVSGAHALKAGQDIHLKCHEDPANHKISLVSLSYKSSLESEITLETNELGEFTAKKHQLALQKIQKRVEGKVGASFYAAALKKGIPAQVIRDAISALAYDINWQHDPKRGDNFIFVYDVYKDTSGNEVKSGNLQYVAFAPGGNMRRVYRFKTASGMPGYFNEKGESVVKALLQTPMDISKLRITSKFSARRKHPILGFCKAHLGVDFGAPKGAAVKAAGDGVVVKASYWGNYGNYIMIKHNNTISTAYAHLSRMKVKAGDRVRQNQIIGNVGSTGRSTGPHLHYEVIKNGVHVNPQTVKQLPSARLDATDLARFRQVRLQIDKENDTLASQASQIAALGSSTHAS